MWLLTDSPIIPLKTRWKWNGEKQATVAFQCGATLALTSSGWSSKVGCPALMNRVVREAAAAPLPTEQPPTEQPPTEQPPTEPERKHPVGTQQRVEQDKRAAEKKAKQGRRAAEKTS